MAEFYAKWAEMRNTANRIEGYSSAIKGCADGVARISTNLPMTGDVTSAIRSNLNKEILKIASLSNKMEMMGNLLEEVSNQYKNTENGLLTIQERVGISIRELNEDLINDFAFILPSAFIWKFFVKKEDFGAAEAATGMETLGFAYNLVETIKKPDGVKNTTKGVKVSGADVVFSLASNIFDNVAEYQEGDMSVERAAGEIAVETAIDVGISIGLGAIAAPIIATIGAPAVVGTLAVAGVTWALNFGCKKLTEHFLGEEKDIGELVGDIVCDAGEYVSEKLKDFGSEVVENASKWWDGMKRGFRSLYT